MILLSISIDRLFNNCGFCLANINKIPQVGDRFTYNEVTFEIVEVDGNKINKVLITKKKDKE